MIRVLGPLNWVAPLFHNPGRNLGLTVAGSVDSSVVVSENQSRSRHLQFNGVEETGENGP